RWAHAVGVTYVASAEYLHHPERVTVTGNPVRPAVLTASRARGRAAFGLPDDGLVLLVFGGSRGARHINSAVVALRDRLLVLGNLYVVQVAGRTEAGDVRSDLAARGGDGDGRWLVLDYVEEMGSLIAAADLVLARAGATSIAEITALGRPMLLVPYPYATDDHQTRNAAEVVGAGAGVLVQDRDLDSPLLAEELLRLLGDSDVRDTMSAASRALGRPDAARCVAALVREASGGRRPGHAPRCDNPPEDLT
ncbi:MAG: glycosyltransferase, partial [Actinomycetota bacterium]|nr:glycosyltransferase [Actinomycetota bacterium]